MTAEDYPENATFFSRSDDDAVPASQANTKIHRGDDSKSDAYLIKYNKYTGLPIWAVDTPCCRCSAIA